MSNSGLTDAEIQIIIRQLFEEELTPAEEQRLLDRLEQAEDDVIPVLRTMLRARDPQTVDTAASVLAAWSADERIIERQIVEPLHQMIEDPDLSDRTKVAVASVLAEQGTPLEPDYFVSQLADPHEMTRATLRSALNQADSDMARAAFLESLETESVRTRVGLIEDLAALEHPAVPRLLAPLLYTSDVAAVEAALDATAGMLEAPRELHRALQHVADAYPDPSIRERAAKLMRRLAPSEALSVPRPLRGLWITSVDGDGGQMIVAAREHGASGQAQAGPAESTEPAPDYVTMLNVYFNDVDGIQDYTVLEGVTTAELHDFLGDLDAEGILVVEAELETGRELLEQARAATLVAGQKLPLGFGVWCEFLAGDDPRELERPRLEPVDLRLHPDWLQESGQLLDHPAYEYWFFDPDDLPTGSVRAYEAAETDSEQTVAVRQALDAHVDLTLRPVLRQRLWRQAGVLARRDEHEAVRLTLAGAAGLAPEADVAPADHPLLQRMMHRTLAGEFEVADI